VKWLEDSEIIDHYWQRDEQAIRESSLKYGPYCFSVANAVLANRQDAEECVNSTWLAAWNSMPPQRPNHLSAFFAKITRNCALNKWKARKAQKRRGNETLLALQELNECILTAEDTADEYQGKELGEVINIFLHQLPKRERTIFLRRYFYVQPVAIIAKQYHLKESNVLVILSRTRKKLQNTLQKGGYLDEEHKPV